MAAKQETSGMDIINNHIKNKTYSGIYLLGGEEKYLMYQYRDKLIGALADTDDSMNYSMFKGENAKVDAIIELALTMPFFADRRVLLIEDSGFFKDAGEAVSDALCKLVEELPETSVIVFVESKIDKTRKLYKRVSKNGTVAMFSTPSEKTLLIWLKGMFTSEGMKVEDAAIYKLLEGVGTDMYTLSNEAEKLKCYCMEKQSVTVSDVDAISISQLENKIFEMMDAISMHDKKCAMNRYDELLQLREPAMRILFLIARQFNILLKTRLALNEGKSFAEIAAIAKVPPFTIKNYARQCEGYTSEELFACLNACTEADTGIKSGRFSDKMAVELLIARLVS